MSLFEPVFAALNAAGVRYVVVGGLATVLHGYARLTAALDLVVDLEPHEAKKAIAALTSVGLVPRAPVNAEDFTKPQVRQSWIEGRGMRVFSMFNPDEPMIEVDLFVDHPIGFADLYKRGEMVKLTSTEVRIAAIDDLIALKRMAGRPEDLLDIEALEAIQEKKRAAKEKAPERSDD